MTQSLIDELLADPDKRRKLAAALAADTPQAAVSPWQSRIRPFIAGMASAAVMMLAFLIPSLDDLWDRYATRQAVQRYAKVGGQLMAEQRYAAAEQAFDRALELAGQQRYDLVELKLRARIERVNDDPRWRGSLPEDLDEGDFLYLLATQRATQQAPQRAETLSAYGTYLASTDRPADAERALREAVRIDPRSVGAHVRLGNLLDDRGELEHAAAEYRRALQLNPRSASAIYNLGVLLAEQGHSKEAIEQLERYVVLAPDDADGFTHLAEQLEAQGQHAAAVHAYESAQKIVPNDTEIGQALLRLRAEQAKPSGVAENAAKDGS